MESDPESVVQGQLEAYNARDLDAFMNAYAGDAEQFEHPAALLARGAAQIRERTAERFREPNLHAHLLNRIVMGNVVVDHERVTRTFAEGPGELELLAIYEVRGDRICRATFIPGARTLRAPATSQ